MGLSRRLNRERVNEVLVTHRAPRWFPTLRIEASIGVTRSQRDELEHEGGQLLAFLAGDVAERRVEIADPR